MRILLLKAVLFVAIGGVLIIPLTSFNLRASREALYSPVFRFAPDKVILIAGDSHTQTSLDPALLPCTVNLSSSGENYFYTYYKLKHFLDLNRNIRSVVLGFAPHNIMKTYDPYIYDNHANQWQTFMPLLDAGARDKISCFKMAYLIPLLHFDYGIPFWAYDDPIPVKKVLRRPYASYDFPFYGGYEQRMGNHVSASFTRSKIASHFSGEPDGYAGVSPDMVQYLHKIAGMCAERKIRLVLFSAPVTTEYRSYIPKRASDDYHKVLVDLQNVFKNVSFIDLSAIDLPKNCYYDCDHLNMDGAKIATGIFVGQVL